MTKQTHHKPKPAIVLVDPITDWKQVINAGMLLDYDIISIQLPDVALPTKFQSFIPSELALKEAGVSHTLHMHHKDIFAMTQQLQILAKECNLITLNMF